MQKLQRLAGPRPSFKKMWFAHHLNVYVSDYCLKNKINKVIE